MPTVDIYSKQQVDALIAGAGGLPDPTSASAGDVLTLDSNKDPAWVAPSGGGITKHTYSTFGEFITDYLNHPLAICKAMFEGYTKKWITYLQIGNYVKTGTVSVVPCSASITNRDIDSDKISNIVIFKNVDTSSSDTTAQFYGFHYSQKGSTTTRATLDGSGSASDVYVSLNISNVVLYY